MHLQPQDIMRRNQPITYGGIMQQVNTRGELNGAGFSDYRVMETNNGAEPVETTRQLFWDMLEILPPKKWTRGNDCESFYVMEALTGDLHEWHIRIGERYFALIAPRSLNHNQIMEKVSKAL